MNVLDILTQTTKEGASDLFIVAGRPLSYKKNGKILQADEERMMPHDCERSCVRSMNWLENGIFPGFLQPETMIFLRGTRTLPVSCEHIPSARFSLRCDPGHYF